MQLLSNVEIEASEIPRKAGCSFNWENGAWVIERLLNRSSPSLILDLVSRAKLAQDRRSFRIDPGVEHLFAHLFGDFW